MNFEKSFAYMLAHILFLLDSAALDSTGQGQKLGDTWEARPQFM